MPRILRANLESVPEIERLFEEAGTLDGLVNNAARFTTIDPLKVTEADWDFIHSVNLESDVFLLPAGRAADARPKRRAHRESQLARRNPAMVA